LKARKIKVEFVSSEQDGSTHGIYPMEARYRNLTYVAPLSLEMMPVIDGREQDTELVCSGMLPIMVKSKLCPLSQLSPQKLRSVGEELEDPGEYFSKMVEASFLHLCFNVKSKLKRACYKGPIITVGQAIRPSVFIDEIVNLIETVATCSCD
jgi:DNA-directed RNA polymerase beta subunit